MARVGNSISMSEAQRDDLKECKRVTGIPSSLILMRLYEAWRHGKITLSTLPSGVFPGPLTPNVQRIPDEPTADM